jgi:hypothetical protein
VVIAAAIVSVIAAAIVPPGTPAAFADPPARPAAEKKEVVPDAEARKYSDFFDKLVAVVVATRDDCVKMAAGIHGHINANQALVQDMNAPRNKNKELPPAVKERIQNQVRDELTPAIVRKCSTDKGVEAAFNRMGGGRAH